MTRKLNVVPYIKDYNYIKEQMKADLDYRLEDRQKRTSLGRPLYERINVQVIMTQECPYKCPFCLERQHPMKGKNNFSEQLQALDKILKEHPNARLTITGGEPSLYINHVKDLIKLYREKSNEVFVSVNTTLYKPEILDVEKDVVFNVSVNDYVKPDLKLFNDDCVYQTVLKDTDMTISKIKEIMQNADNVKNYSFRYLTEIDKSDYDITLFNDLQRDNEVTIKTFRIGDFFVYLTFEYKGKKARITLGDMNTQISNDYQDGYSNIIVHPDGKVGVNWR